MTTQLSTLDYDRARLLHADPQHFINAARLLEELLDGMTAFPQGQRVMMFTHVTPLLATRMAQWGSDLVDFEDDADLEDNNDAEHSHDGWSNPHCEHPASFEVTAPVVRSLQGEAS